MTSLSPPLHNRIASRFGSATYTVEAYIECRRRIARDFYPEHHLMLKQHYRGQFIVCKRLQQKGLAA